GVFAAATIAASLLLRPAPGRAVGRGDLSGTWKLDRERSDDPGQKFADGGGTSGHGSGGGGFRGRRGGGGFGGRHGRPAEGSGERRRVQARLRRAALITFTVSAGAP